MLALVVGLLPSAAPAQPSDSSARRLAADIERRAEATSFADLQRFGSAQVDKPGREALRRLHHVALVFLNQSEFDQFDHWNNLLAAKAGREGDLRYFDVAHIDALKSRYDRGDTSVRAEIEHLAASDPDWLARVHAISTEAAILNADREVGRALKLLFEGEALIPASDPDSGVAESDVWGAIGIGLIQLNDLEGSADAFQKADFVYADPAYPQPDFDDVYNMAYLAAQLGQASLAHDLAAAHHRLAMRSDLPHLAVWDKYLCAVVAESAGPPAGVTDCLAGIDARLTGAEFLAPRLLSMRGVAYAREGRIADAEADLARLKGLEASRQFAASAFSREPELEAELLAAKGQAGPAFGRLRDVALRRMQLQAQRSSIGVSQVTAELERQLHAAQHEEELEKKVVRGQYWIFILGGLLAAGAAAALVWQRRAALRLRIAQQKAEAASLSKTEFLANMSHEIRTPLNGVVAVADMLSTAGLPERERKMAEIIRSSGQSLERLLSDVLDLARVEAGQLTIEAAPFHAGDLVRAVAALCRLRADEKGLALVTEIDPALERWFVGDVVRVRQILTNFTSNAVKFTSQGRVTLRGEAVEGGRLRFSVSDTGVGFSPEVKARLFARFQQADGSITRRFGGSGLGLAISRQLAVLMDGVVDCESAEGAGSRFWFEAPFAETAPPQESVGTDEAAVGGARAVRVLVVDDHATNQMVVRMMLEQFGIEAVVVDDGAQAVEAVRAGGFDAVLMDMQMPVMDGLEATRRIRAEEAATARPRTPILMLSANALAEHRAAGEEAGADGHVAKPVTVAGLMGALNAVLEPAETPADEALAAAG
ncbi:MAG TPA: ATP-binding protein [Caulobacteraceae bacterium]|nr:ATP-binding protein [Caulobacteraceae bacterium]